MQVNARADEMAQIIKARCNFEGKRVVDFGCGYGDMMLAALEGGADFVLGVDKDDHVLDVTFEKCNKFGADAFYHRSNFDDRTSFQTIMEIAGRIMVDKLDVAFCFAVLPYLKDPTRFVNMLGDNFRDVFIETQYIGDGPGNFVKDDKEMSKWLKDRGFDIAVQIGQTFVEGRDKHRSIWQCYRWKDE